MLFRIVGVSLIFWMYFGYSMENRYDEHYNFGLDGLCSESCAL